MDEIKNTMELIKVKLDVQEQHFSKSKSNTNVVIYTIILI